MSVFKCDLLGTINMVDAKKQRSDADRETRYFVSDYSPDNSTLNRMREIARTIAGIESVEKSNRDLENGKTADFCIVFQPGIKAPQATQSSIDMMNRVARNLNLRAKHDRGGMSLAVHSDVIAWDQG